MYEHSIFVCGFSFVCLAFGFPSHSHMSMVSLYESTIPFSLTQPRIAVVTFVEGLFEMVSCRQSSSPIK